ncbi:metallophosphoesterase family protein [Mangrovicoccus algicola]|uniref:Metallophosphoesterase family protein n=1 Tax=Mangrovicoccus algicola TaxID=2771008 RepID=A0A8J6YX98_9RHOB|nr:metallophosphoesterase family protein [Mangrovicoccus algicola]MBE3639337.1 metallophosphoesterase family protein [Mangrovicoccus algicola]
MRILAFSDLHCDRGAAQALVDAAAGADLVVGAGDFATAHRGLAETMDALKPLESKAVYVPGNNETTAALRAATRARVLHGETIEIGGLAIAGIGGAVPPLPPLPWRSHDLTEDEAEAMLAPVERADLLICHSPPEGIADRLEDGRGIGSTALRAAIARIRPRLAVCGHIHACWGEEGRIGGTRVVNLGPGPNWFDL